MEDQAMEWENKEQGENGGNMAWILNKGLTVGKKMLITGVVISSAPVILPPLMIISTLGLVCAVPYGLFLATYACTEKLITTLLPSPKPLPLTFEELEAKDVSDEYGGDVDMANEEEELRRRVDLRLEQDEKGNHEEGVNGKDEMVEKNGYVEDVETKEDEKPSEDVRGVMIVIEREEENGSGVKEDVSYEVTDVAVELCLKDDDSKANEELVKETTGLLEKIREEGKSDEAVGKDEQSAKGGRGDAEQGLKGADRDVQESETKLGHGNGRKTKKTKANQAKQNRKASNVETREVAKESKTDLSADKKADRAGSATPEESKKPSVKNIDILEVTVPSNVKAPGSGGTASNEVLYSEEKIWKHIDAMRAIVGYTTDRNVTCMEELKALYVFTGVEPPASFKDPSDLVEINDKLRFLMSVVGVK